MKVECKASLMWIHSQFILDLAPYCGLALFGDHADQEATVGQKLAGGSES